MLALLGWRGVLPHLCSWHWLSWTNVERHGTTFGTVNFMDSSPFPFHRSSTVSNSIHHGPWLVAQSEEHSPGKRKVPGSNPGRSLCHFFRSVVSHSSLSPIYFAARTFNELPKHLQSIKNLSEFKRRAQQHFLSYSCPCSNHHNRSA